VSVRAIWGYLPMRVLVMPPEIPTFGGIFMRTTSDYHIQQE